MFESIKSWLYDFIAWTGILLHVYPYVKRLMRKLNSNKTFCNYMQVDEGGATICLSKYKGRVFAGFAVGDIARVAGLGIRKDDVMICGYPKTGCHWVYEIMYMLMNGKAKLSKHGKVVSMIDGKPPIVLDSVPSPRILNSHFTYDDLPLQMKERKTKIVLTVRSPKDTVVSFYHHVSSGSPLYQYSGTFDNFFKMWMAGKLESGTYFDYILSWMEVMKNQNDNPILVVEYEKLKQKPFAVVREIARFLDIPTTDSFIEAVLKECDFEKMKKERSGQSIGRLFRKGQVGDWHNWLTDEQSSQINRVWKDRMTDCCFQPEL